MRMLNMVITTTATITQAASKSTRMARTIPYMSSIPSTTNITWAVKVQLFDTHKEVFIP
jgi:hypothetical protein